MASDEFVRALDIQFSDTGRVLHVGPDDFPEELDVDEDGEEPTEEEVDDEQAEDGSTDSDDSDDDDE